MSRPWVVAALASALSVAPPALAEDRPLPAPGDEAERARLEEQIAKELGTAPAAGGGVQPAASPGAPAAS